MSVLDHVALVVREIEPVLARCVSAGLTAGPIEDFPGEGTREVYLGAPGSPARLLLMQPSKDSGPYARALAKRGPGLHHLAVHVPDLAAYLAETRWLLHPASVHTIAHGRAAWLARPGIATLLEIQEATSSYDGPPVVEGVEVPVASGLEHLLDLQVEGLSCAPQDEGSLLLAGNRLSITELVV